MQIPAMRRGHLPILAGFIGWVLAAASADANAAGPVVDSGGFEQYTLGTLQGQQGWQAAGSNASTATVQSGTVHSGSKALEVFRAPNADRRWAVPKSGLPTGRFVVIDWDMQVLGTGQEGFGPFFGVEAYDDRGTLGLLGSLGVDASTGDVLYQNEGFGALVETGKSVTFGAWHHYRMLLDFSVDQYSVFFDGSKILTSGFVDKSLGLDDFTDADIAALAAGADSFSQGLSGTAYFDNFFVSDGVMGDFDDNGVVNTNDLTVWRQAFGTADAGDTTSDGFTDGRDLLVWQRSLGTNVLAATPVATSTPEPSASLLAVLAAFGFAKAKRCGAKRQLAVI